MERLGIVLLICGLLIFGCASPSGGAQPGTGSMPASGGVTPPGQGPGGANQPSAPPLGNNTTGDEQNPGNSLLGKTYEELIGLGIPLQCDIIMPLTGNQTTTAKVYVNGNEQMRSEMDLGEGVSACSKMITIVNGNKVDMKCVEGTIFPQIGANNPFEGCVWMETVANATSGGSPSAQSADYSNVPPARISCLPWVYDASMFEVSGKACNIEEIMKSYYGNAGMPG
jgi:hypothetical protein